MGHHIWMDGHTHTIFLFLMHDGLLHEVIEGRMKGKPTRGTRIHMLYDSTNDDGYVALKRAA